MSGSCCGPMAERVRQYFQLRESFGAVLRNARMCLSEFDTYLAAHYHGARTVTREMVEGYLATTKNLQSRTRYDRVTHLRQFCRFLLQFDPEGYIPERGLVRHGEVQVKPHIYSEEETCRVIQLALLLPPSDCLRPHTYATLIGLLWVTGLRIGEAIRLNVADVDLEVGLLNIQNSKFHKSRLVPLSHSATVALRVYLEKRRSFDHDTAAAAPFFLNERKRRCSYRTVHETFRQLIKKTGLRTLQGGLPRLHDFRHSFATRWLAEVTRGGKDPNVFLPVLATYLGHANISHTQVYLHPSVEVLRQAGEKLQEHLLQTLRGL